MKLAGNGAGETYANMFVTGEIQYRAVFLEASRLLNLSVPCRCLLFPSPPPLPPVNRLSIRLPPRISVDFPIVEKEGFDSVPFFNLLKLFFAAIAAYDILL